MENRVTGYKAFHKDMKNRYGKTFEEGKTYHIKGPLKFGNDGNGIHFCSNLEDTLRYVPGMEEEIVLASVSTDSEVVEFSDEYYGYYDMFVASKLTIDHVLTREEIITKYLTCSNQYAVKRFLEGYKLTPEEINIFKIVFADSDMIIRTIEFYQERKLDAFSKKYVL